VQGVASMKSCLIKQVPLQRSKNQIYFMFLLAEAFDLMTAGDWMGAQALIALGLVAGEQAAMDHWSWHTAWLLTFLPDPPFHLLQDSLGPHLTRPHAKLADHSWINAAAAYTKDMAILAEARKGRGQVRDSREEVEKPKGQKKGGGRGAGAEELA